MTELDFAIAFEPHPLDGQSRFMLLGALAGLVGVVSPLAWSGPVTDEQRRLAQGVDPALGEMRVCDGMSLLSAAQQEFRDKHAAPGLYPPGVLDEAERQLFAAPSSVDHVEVMHPERWEKVLGLEPGQLRDTEPAPPLEPEEKNP